MKKGLIFILLVTIIITTLLFFTDQKKIIQLDNGEKAFIAIQEENEIDLNKFYVHYKNNLFEKVEIVDGEDLIGYQFIGTGSKGVSLNLQKELNNLNYIIYTTKKPYDTSITELGLSLTGSSTPIHIINNEKSLLSSIFLEQILPLLFFVLVLVFLLKMFGGKGGGFPFGAQAGKLRTKADIKTNFKDVAGMDESKAELEEIVDFLKAPTKYQKAGARIPSGVLLYGPPGSGKTLLARAVAGEADVAFFSASGSEFMEMLVGMGAAKVRELFNKAKQAAPAIVFIDEIDTIGKKRGMGYTGGHQEQEQTLNQILTEMDGFDKETKVIVIAATNRPDILDPALMRPGRFDRKVYIGRPALEERHEILKIHARDKKLDDGVELEMIARRTSGFVGADLANIMNEAALNAAKTNRQIINMNDIEYALEKIVMGPEKKIKTIKEQERKIIAYHELGHAVSAYKLPNTDPVEKISIVSRGLALGVTWILPQEDTYLYSKSKFLDEICTLLGGRVTEEIIFGKDEITTGASNDFEKATSIASDMILKYGMDEELGTILYHDKDKAEFYPYKNYSEKTGEIIDEKIKTIVKGCYDKTKQIITENKVLIDKMAIVLLDKEYITKDEFEDFMQDTKKVEEAIKNLEIKKKEKENNKNNEIKNADKKQTKKKSEKKKNIEKNEKEVKKDKSAFSEILDKYLKK